MDKECIRKHRKEFDAWLEGGKIEFLTTTDEWEECYPSWDNIYCYRIKPEAVHYHQSNPVGGAICRVNSFCATFTTDKSQVTCKSCLELIVKSEWIHYHTDETPINKHGLFILCDAKIDPLSGRGLTGIKSQVTCPDCLEKLNLVHYLSKNDKTLCKENSNTDRLAIVKSAVTCKECLAILNCKYPNLRKAIQERKEFFVKGTYSELGEVKNIANNCNCFHLHKSDFWTTNDNFKYLWFAITDGKYCYTRHNYNIPGVHCNKEEFHLATDSFATPLPEWIKVGAKCFYVNSTTPDVAFNIENIHGEYVEIKSKSSTADVHFKSLTPAVFQPPTCAELVKYMPLCLKLKGKRELYKTVVSLNADSVLIFGSIADDIKAIRLCDLSKEYTYADGSEIGKWARV